MQSVEEVGWRNGNFAPQGGINPNGQSQSEFQDISFEPAFAQFGDKFKMQTPLPIQDRIIKNRSLQVCDLLIMRYVANARATL